MFTNNPLKHAFHWSKGGLYCSLERWLDECSVSYLSHAGFIFYLSQWSTTAAGWSSWRRQIFIEALRRWCVAFISRVWVIVTRYFGWILTSCSWSKVRGRASLTKRSSWDSRAGALDWFKHFDMIKLTVDWFSAFVRQWLIKEKYLWIAWNGKHAVDGIDSACHLMGSVELRQI